MSFSALPAYRVSKREPPLARAMNGFSGARCAVQMLGRARARVQGERSHGRVE